MMSLGSDCGELAVTVTAAATAAAVVEIEVPLEEDSCAGIAGTRTDCFRRREEPPMVAAVEKHGPTPRMQKASRDGTIPPDSQQLSWDRSYPAASPAMGSCPTTHAVVVVAGLETSQGISHCESLSATRLQNVVVVVVVVVVRDVDRRRNRQSHDAPCQVELRVPSAIVVVVPHNACGLTMMIPAPIVAPSRRPGRRLEQKRVRTLLIAYPTFADACLSAPPWRRNSAGP